MNAQRRPDRCENLFHALVGIVFLGTPHPSEDDSKWGNVFNILQAFYKTVPKHLADAEQLSCLSRACGTFENLKLNIPIVSTWETKETRLKRPILRPQGRLSRACIVSVALLFLRH